MAIPTSQNPSSTPSPIIELDGIIREFRAGEQTIRVLHDIDLTIYQGEMLAIIGQSGSGKSTLMNILGCLDQPTAGDYRIFGKSVQSLDADELAELRREYFGFIFQRYHLLGDINARDNVAVPAVYAGMNSTTRQQRAEKLLADLGLAGKEDNRPNQLSGGQQQRVSIARALMNGGSVILADEPTGALDSKSGEDVMAILKDLHAKGHTIIMVTHDPSIAKQAERVIELKDGYVIADYHNTLEDNASDSPVSHTSHIATDHTPAPQFNTQKKGGLASFLDRLIEAFKMSLYAMRAHKMRTLLTMLGIIIGIASVVSVVGLGKGSQEQILASISSLGTNTITVQDGYPWGDPRRRYDDDNLTPADAEAVASQPYVISVSPQLDSNASVRYRNVEESASVSGVGEDYLQVTGETLAMGQGFDADSIARRTQDAIINDDARTTFFADTDKQDNPIGEVIMIGNVPARIVGVLAVNDNAFMDAGTPTIYLPYTTVMSRINGTPYIERFVARIDPSVASDVAETAIHDLMMSRHGTDDFRLRNSDAIRDTVESTTGALTALISAIAIISLLVGGIGVMNIMLVSVTERTSEIGVRMAVGARQSDIMGQFLIEAILVCVLGGGLGVLLAFAIGEGINSLGSDRFSVIYSPVAIVMAFVCSTLIGIIFGFLPARNASRLNPVEALSRD